MSENKGTVGDLLKQARLRQRLSVAECAKRTHIAPRFIEALEEENWNALPSESHRLGFLRLYARFLGVSAEEALALYRQKMQASTQTSGDAVEADVTEPTSPSGKLAEARARIRTAPRTSWSPSSIPQLIGLAIVVLIFAWVLYHALSPRLLDSNAMPWTKRKTTSEPRLTVPSNTRVQMQKIRVTATEDCWLRLTSKELLLYEGILRAGTIKEWSGPGPFQFKAGNAKAISILWNDQPFDTTTGSRGNTNTFRIPPA